MALPKKLVNLSENLSSLPGIGPKLSTRLALYMSINAKPLAKRLAESIDEVMDSLRACNVCGNITEEEVCEICENSERDNSVIMIVEDSLDLYNIEGADVFKGLYHVIGGLISPVNGVSPSDLNIRSLSDRVAKSPEVKEIVFALNPTIEGDSTSMYIKNEILRVRGDIEFTQLAKGIASGSDIEFTSSKTLGDSVRSRSRF
jgi:recombination protein RecR